MEEEKLQAEESQDPALDEALDLTHVNPLIKEALTQAGFTTLRQLLSAKKEELSEKIGISEDAVETLLSDIKKTRKQ